MFIDYVEIDIKAGNGGNGCVAFHTEKFIPKGGPDGGDGGRGASVVGVANPQLTTLLDFRYKKHIKADNGRPGEGKLRSGKSGNDLEIQLPVGTLVKDLDTNELVADFDEPNKRIVIAKGGRGGWGNDHFKSATNQAPRIAKPGQPGEQKRISLELKLLADVGLVGLPNAGKSTILSVFSAARPKIADYPFTTLVPNLGIVKLHGYNSCVMADIPGLIEGAAKGKGLGHQFLKHIQRTRLIVYIIDVNDLMIKETLDTLKQELESFDSNLLNMPSLIVITKMDTVSEDDIKVISKDWQDDYIQISAVTGFGSDKFLNAIENILYGK
jgi:GTPase